ncbi:LysR family transcriptional regulator [Paracoccus sp. SCSIO 75233]|uniref:LysR family transcriptional regulator n=1 Tax=Paracoccus sp. SCSIO 75233 TaxID=3017782 RepID=UPI0022EFF881|nr:LysR family transcriptional regulator [Paracoccus sp. SCSIO 75233]WBU53377.1 LysR substrate-binding domain-containing protein [Paracoccus sp. SCSIO 75233]
MRREDVADLIAFAAVAEAGSFTRAAQTLGVTQSALSQIVKRLEERLGLRLLARTTRSVAPTEGGERLLKTLRPMLHDLERSVASLNELRDKPAGTIRITTVEHAAKTILTPLLSRMLKDYPEITVEIVIDYGLADIVAERFDAGIRLGEAVERDMVALRISDEIPMVIVGAPSYLAQHGCPQTPDELTAHRGLNLRLPTSGTLNTWRLAQDGQEMRVRVDGPLIFNTIDLIRDAARAGVGLAYMPRDQVDEDLISGRLVTVMEGWTPPLPAYHLYYPSRRQSSAAFRLFVDALRRNTRR